MLVVDFTPEHVILKSIICQKTGEKKHKSFLIIA